MILRRGLLMPSPAVLVPAAGGSFDTDAATYFARMSTQENSTFKSAVDAFVIGCKADGTWSLLDRFGIGATTAAQANSLFCLKQATKSFTTAGTVLWTSGQGYQGNAIDFEINAGEVANAAGNSYALNSAHIGAYINAANDALTGVAYPMVGLAGNGNTFLQVRIGSAGTWRVNTTANSANAAQSTRKGHRMLNRVDSANHYIYLNGTQNETDARASGAISALNTTWLRHNTAYGIDRLGAWHSGQGMTPTQAANFASRLHTMMTALGANY